MQQIIAIALGGSAGALLRFYTANAIHAWLGRDFPHGTLFINVSGSFLIGFLTQLFLLRFPDALEYRAALLVGFLGAYTTFSTFSLETFNLLDDGQFLKAGTYAFLSVGLCLVATWVGMIVGRRLFSSEFPEWFTADLAYGRFLGILFTGFVLGLISEWVFIRYGWVVSWRSLTLMTLLGLLTLATLLLMLPILSHAATENRALLALFAASALGSALSVWAGMAVAKQW